MFPIDFVTGEDVLRRWFGDSGWFRRSQVMSNALCHTDIYTPLGFGACGIPSWEEAPRNGFFCPIGQMESQEFLAFQDHILVLEYLVQRWFDFFVVRGMYCTDFNLDNLELLRFVSWRIDLLKIQIFRIFHCFLYVSQRVNQINHQKSGPKKPWISGPLFPQQIQREALRRRSRRAVPQHLSVTLGAGEVTFLGDSMGQNMGTWRFL